MKPSKQIPLLLAVALFASGCALFQKSADETNADGAETSEASTETNETVADEADDADEANASEAPEAEVATETAPTPEDLPPAVAPGAPQPNFFARLWQRVFPPKEAGPPAAVTPTWVGTIKVISGPHRYVLIDSQPYYALEPGTVLHSVGSESETATLRVSADRDPPFFIADVVSGTPQVGNRVYAPSL